MNDAYRWLLKWARTLHIYLSMFALLALLFFAATGFMLNHVAWFNLETATTEDKEVELPPEMVGETLDKLQLVEHLRAEHGALGRVDPFEPEEKTVHVVFRSPGHTVEYDIDRESGATKITTESFGLNGRLTDLHKGKGTGTAWNLVIDGVSLLLAFISLTGLLLWVSLKRRIALGILAAVVSSAALVAIYVLTVP